MNVGQATAYPDRLLGGGPNENRLADHRSILVPSSFVTNAPDYGVGRGFSAVLLR